ncbi:MAG: SpoIID/LytB domain-containing protein [Candidatus Omnitrophota bacterium]|nr:SpoIID/LytB domain-containing protein [Candidatus Omnitrophota bacterium]
MKKLLHIPVIIAALSFFLAGTGVSVEQKHDIVLRVSIVDDKDRVSLDLKGRYKIYAINSDRVVMEGPYFSSVVTAQKEGLKIGKKDIKLSGVKVKVDKDANIYVNSRRFRGDMDIIRKDNGKLVVVNHIPIDYYLYGVLYHEVSHRWPAEVLKAQAITARTFALYQARQNKLQPYDLRSDIYSQVYGGRASEKWSTTRAVDLTRSEVLTYKGDIIPTYYHATCAGYTEDASNLWNIDAPYLKGAPCDHCRDSKHYRWTKEMPLWELANKLKNGGYKIGKIASVTILSKNRSGRIDKIEIKDEAGISVILTGKDFRQLIGPNELRSAKFDASIKWNSLIMEGLGWGHGVGMCQWGAYGMARKGKKAEEILEYYYPGTEISTIDKIKL